MVEERREGKRGKETASASRMARFSSKRLTFFVKTIARDSLRNQMVCARAGEGTYAEGL